MMQRTRVLSVTLLLPVALLALTTSSNAAINDALVAHYTFDGNAIDASGNGNDAVAYNDYDYISGVSNQAIHLVGMGHVELGGGHVVLPSFPLETWPEFTIGLWVDHQGHTSYHGESFISFGRFPHGDTVEIAYHYGDQGSPDGRMWFHVGNASLEVPYVLDFAKGWQHYLLTADNGTLTGYVNGNSIGSVDYTLGSIVDNTAGLGCHWFDWGGTSSNRFIGSIDDVRIYDRALSEVEIEQLAAVVPEPSSLVLFSGMMVTMGVFRLRRRRQSVRIATREGGSGAF